jgi:serine-type D-Ala-D-Ala carboxypeptidase
MRHLAFTLCIAVALASAPAQTSLPTATPESLSLSAEALAKIDLAVRQALDRGDAPGVVVVIVHKGAIVFRKAYGSRSLQPAATAMLPEIVFDLASLTKPIATATSVMVLVDQGKLKLSAPLAQYLPAFRRKETEQITVEQLLLHTSGFIADNPLKDYQAGIESAWNHLLALKPVTDPGSKFTYSDINYILMGKLVETVSGQTLDAFAQQHIFTPLGLADTMFKPPAKLQERIAPTEKRGDAWMLGEVHDPRSFALSGVAGHAGLFSTGDDLAVFTHMLLNGGEYKGKRILQPDTVKLMTTPREVPLGGGKKGLRAYGWDVQTAYSSNRGSVFPSGKSFGHTGFTGTSLWIDPGSKTAVIVLTSRVHPHGKGNVTKLRSEVATLAASAILQKQ